MSSTNNNQRIMYLSDFNLRNYQNNKDESNDFTVILKGNKNVRKIRSMSSVIDATRPLIYFSSIFGILTINPNTFKMKILNRVYSLMLIMFVTALVVFVKPANWDNTIKDIPLKILTISMGIQETIEIVCFVFITSFRNSENYMKLYKTFSELDDNFALRHKTFIARRYLAILLTAVPIAALLLIVWLRKLSVHNLVSHLIFFLLMLQGAICVFFLLNIFSNLIILHVLLLKKSQLLNVSKYITFVCSTENILKRLAGYTQTRNPKNVCWFELMQIYDKIADTIYIFNVIYNEQVLVMFNSWIVTTLLAICRVISPTVQYSHVIMIESLLYVLINARPILVTNMSECFVLQGRKIYSTLLHLKLHLNQDYYYKDQIDMMLDLVRTRKLEISTKAFPVNIRVAMNFTGSVISYAVLMIQYFYMYIHEIEEI